MENLNIWKKSKMTDFWSKAVQKKNQVINTEEKSSDKRVTPTYKS